MMWSYWVIWYFVDSLLQVQMRDLADGGLTVSTLIGKGASIIEMMWRVDWLDFIYQIGF